MTSNVKGVTIGSQNRPTEKKLKNSVSTPELRLSQVILDATSKSSRQVLQKQPRSLPRGKDRWLSAETWCDALLFPRPRLKIKHDGFSASEHLSEDSFVADGSLFRTGSNRVVSPPSSPLGGEWDIDIRNGVETQILEKQRLSGDRNRIASGDLHEQKQMEPGIASRVLAHSRSLIDLRQRHRMGMETDRAKILNVLSSEKRALDENAPVQEERLIVAEGSSIPFPTPAPSLD